MTKAQLVDLIRRRLGYPMVKVELSNQQVMDEIDYSRQKWVKWAVGQATQEVYFTLELSAGEFLYDLPAGVVEVVGYKSKGIGESINTLFTLENYLYSQGLYDALIKTSISDGYSLVSYHVARDFLHTVERYIPDEYNFKYHPYTNQLEIRPVPGTTNLSTGSIAGESQGYLLVRSYMVQQSSYTDSWNSSDTYQNFFEFSDWIQDYALARCKIILGRIRGKFANFASLGNTGISLDGDQLIQEGKEEIERLEETLRLEEAYDGYGVDIA